MSSPPTLALPRLTHHRVSKPCHGFTYASFVGIVGELCNTHTKGTRIVLRRCFRKGTLTFISWMPPLVNLYGTSKLLQYFVANLALHLHVTKYDAVKRALTLHITQYSAVNLALETTRNAERSSLSSNVTADTLCCSRRDAYCHKLIGNVF